jgi:chaperonin GroES
MSENLTMPNLGLATLLESAARPTLTIRPIEDWIVFRFEDIDSGGRIVLPDSADPRSAPSSRKKVVVVAVGPGRVTMSGERIPIPIQPGDRLAMAPSASFYSYDLGEKLYLIRESEVAGVIERVAD